MIILATDMKECLLYTCYEVHDLCHLMFTVTLGGRYYHQIRHLRLREVKALAHVTPPLVDSNSLGYNLDCFTPYYYEETESQRGK